jgi:hypothetical protein
VSFESIFGILDIGQEMEKASLSNVKFMVTIHAGVTVIQGEQ